MRLALFIFSLVVFTSAAKAAEKVDIPHGEQTLHGILYRAAGKDNSPAIVALHGCGGLTDKTGKIRPQYEDWAEKLSDAGYTILFPDSFESRGLSSQCRVQRRKVRPRLERVDDAIAARAWLQSQNFVQADRVFLLGWSNGASTTLWTVRPGAAPKDGKPDFRSAIAFYPGCRSLANAAWSARIPTLILIGLADDWTPARECDRMIAGASGRSAKTTIVKYKGAYHSFDRANFPLRELSGLAFTPEHSGHAHVGGNPDARADALKQVPNWLSR